MWRKQRRDEAGRRRRRPSLRASARTSAVLAALAASFLLLCVPAAVRAQGVDYFVLLDTSGSMAGSNGRAPNDTDRVAVLATHMLHELIGDRLCGMASPGRDDDCDRFALISHHPVQVRVGLGDRTARSDSFWRALGAYDGGSTRCDEGAAAIQAARAGAGGERPAVVVVLGDGACVGTDDYESYAAALRMLSAGGTHVVYAALGADARRSYDFVAGQRIAGVDAVALESSDLFGDASTSLLGAFARAIARAAGTRDTAELTPTSSTIGGCFVGSATRLLVVADAEFGVELVAAGAGAHRPAPTRRGSYRHAATSQAYHYAIYDDLGPAADELSLRVTGSSRWRALLVPRPGVAALTVAGAPCSFPLSGAAGDTVLDAGDAVCAQTELTGASCATRNPGVEIRALDAAPGAVLTTFDLRSGGAGRYEGTSGWQCASGAYEARVVAREGGTTAPLSAPVRFRCESCSIAAGRTYDAEASWCDEVDRRSFTATLPMGGACSTGALIPPSLVGDHAPCFELVDAQRSGADAMSLSLVFDPSRSGCALAEGAAQATVELDVDGAGPLTETSALRVTLYDPYAAIAVDSSSALVEFERCTPGANLAHLTLRNASSCAVVLDAARLEVGDDTVSLVAPGGEPASRVARQDGTLLVLAAGESMELGELATARSLCALDGTIPYSVRLVTGRARVLDGASGQYEMLLIRGSRPWYVCWGYRVVLGLAGLLVLLAALALLIMVFGYPAERRRLELALSRERGAARNHTYAGNNLTVERRNAGLKRLIGGRTSYTVVVDPDQHDLRPASSPAPKDYQERTLSVSVTDTFAIDHPGGLLASAKVEPAKLHRYRDGMLSDAIEELTVSAQLRDDRLGARGQIAARVGPLLHRLRWPVYLLIPITAVLLALAWLAWRSACSP